MTLHDALSAHEEALLGCVHCGFCLPVCPTYTRLGDEADSPRGRLVLMRAVVEGRLDAGHDAFQTHIDRCLGCRACETVCPSGVAYGHLLERARQEAAAVRGRDPLTRATLWLFGQPMALAAALLLGRIMRATGVPAVLARILPDSLGRTRLAAGMLASTSPGRFTAVGGVSNASSKSLPQQPRSKPANGVRTAILEGCIQEGLFSHVNAATRRVLQVNGASIVDAPGQRCCGALHAHAGDLDGARVLARRNIDAFEASGADQIVVNAAGCGATMSEYGELLVDDDAYRDRARALSSRVRDVSVALAASPVLQGSPLETSVAYDAPCHLIHGQGVSEAPLTVLEAVPGLDLNVLPSSSECCGGAGTYGITHAQLAGAIGNDKVDDIEASGASFLATGNPGCIMQIGAGVRSRGLPTGVVHPIELLDESYRRAGLYQGS